MGHRHEIGLYTNAPRGYGWSAGGDRREDKLPPMGVGREESRVDTCDREPARPKGVAILLMLKLGLLLLAQGCSWRPAAASPAPVASTPLLPCEWMAGEQPIWAIDDVDLEEWPACDRGEGVGR